MSRRHVLIGSGPASVAAAEVIRRCDDAAEIVIVGDEPHGYYSRPGLAYYLANEEPESVLFPFTAGDFARLGVRVLLERTVRIDADDHRVTLSSGDRLPYDRLLVATGSTALEANVPGADLDGVVKLDDLDDARDLIRRSHSARVAVVIGGGITALEIVEGLRARRMHVHYLMRKGRYWSNVLSEAESRMVEDGLRRRDVQIHEHTEIARILGHKGRVVGIETTAGTQIPCDLVAVALGVRPLSASTLVGLALNAFLHWGWADPAAALIVAVAALRESRENWIEAAAVTEPSSDAASLEARSS
jgi:nitrite reductase (NADH) large subunit